MSTVGRIREAYRRLEQVDRPEVWIAVRPEADALADAFATDTRVGAGDQLPLAGTTLAVKDNIDVAGLATTAGCPAFAYEPEHDAPVVARLRAAGATVIGKTNLDQFATGLVGTRSPYGAVRDAARPEYVSGGSSSGSAVAVAVGVADLALGTDTAGSGRVPAAFGGIVGLKPTRGLVPTRGVVPACRTLDCVTIFAAELARAEEAMAAMVGPDAGDPLSREWPHDAPLAAPPTPRVAVPSALPELGQSESVAFWRAVDVLRAAGVLVTDIDLSPFLEAASLLYEGGFVAERYQAVGTFVQRNRDRVDPTVGQVIAAAGRIPAHVLVSDEKRLGELRIAALAQLDGADALLVPTAPFQPTIAEAQADPIQVNNRLGTYTSFCNLLDLSAVAVPAGHAGEGQFGVTIVARGFADRVACDVARLLVGGRLPDTMAEPPGKELLVVGAHLSGQPLNAQLTARGGRLLGPAQTAPHYRLYALDTIGPAKPGLLRVGRDGAAVQGELWSLPAVGLGTLLADLPPPMTLGPVELKDGRNVVGFGCASIAIEGARDITDYGGWLAYLADQEE